MLIDLVQDLDVLLPVLLAIRQSTELEARVVVLNWLNSEAPRVRRILKAHGISFHNASRQAVITGRSPSLGGIAAVLTASESAADAHLAGFRLAARANATGIPTYTLQHGWEFDVELRANGASQHFFCWGPLPDKLSGPTYIPIGRPFLESASSPIFDLGLFENLHWDRYSTPERLMFVGNLFALADARPNLSLLVRTHPAGGWLDSFGEQLRSRRNVTFQSSLEARRSLQMGVEAVTSCRRIITTPSTIALDAAMTNRPVALAFTGGAAYSPLPIVRSIEEWLAFADGEVASETMRLAFLERLVGGGQGASLRLLERLRLDLGRVAN